MLGMAVATSACAMVGALSEGATPTQSVATEMTSTAANTPEPKSTATASRTPAPTATPLPPVGVVGCLGDQDCGTTARSIRTFLDRAPQGGASYNLSIPASTKLRFTQGWCAVDDWTLGNTLVNYEFVFKVDGVSYLDQLKRGPDTITDSKDSSVTYPCMAVGGFLHGWKVGETHTVVIGGRVINASIWDGWDVYPVGETVTTYVITLINATEAPLATATKPSTPTRTVTRTPTRTNTPLPLPTNPPAPTIPPEPQCGEKGSIVLDNQTKGTVTIYLKGPAQYTYLVPLGRNTYTVCGGAYTFTAYGCGGAALSGTIGTSSDSYFKFYCN